MRVAHDRAAAHDHVLQLTEALEELVVELLLLKQLCVAAGEGLLGLGECWGEAGDAGLGVARQLSLKIRDLVFETGNEADDSFEPLIVEPADGRMAKNEYPLCANGIG